MGPLRSLTVLPVAPHRDGLDIGLAQLRRGFFSALGLDWNAGWLNMTRSNQPKFLGVVG
jgi:hypothetical protein